MIESLRGKLLVKKPLHIVIDVQGVGYGLDVPLTTLAQLPPVGHEAFVFVHTHVQEDAIRLFGFADDQDRVLFLAIVSVSGIGPRTALAIMSELPAQELAHAIVTEDLKTLSKVKGIGKKTAERMVLELHDKVLKFLRSVPAFALASDAEEDAGTDADGKKTLPVPAMASMVNEAIDALVSLDCKRPVAEKAVVSAAKELGPEAELAQLIRLALRYR